MPEDKTKPASSGSSRPATPTVTASTSDLTMPATPTVIASISGSSKSAMPSIATEKLPAGNSNISTPSSTAILLELREQIAMLQRQLTDTQAQLSAKQASQEPSSKPVSDHNLILTTSRSPFATAIDLTPTAICNLNTAPNLKSVTVPSTQILSATTPTQTTSYSIATTPTQPASTIRSVIPPTQPAPATHSVTPPTLPAPATYSVIPPTQPAPATYSFIPPTQPAPAIYSVIPPTQPAPAMQSTNIPFETYANSSPFWGIANNYHQQPTPIASNFLRTDSAAMMPRKLQDLPPFSGVPEDWPLFYTAYCQSTAAYGYTNFENNQRLQKFLKGEAKEIVLSLLILPDNVNAVIEHLKFRFGRPEQLIHSQLKKVKELPYINESNINKLVPFSTKVQNLSVFLKSAGAEQHLANPTLLEELISKLPMSKKLEWAKVAVNIKPYPTIQHFSEWLCEVVNLVCMVQDVNGNESKRRVLHATENVIQCPVCKENHKIHDCNKFLKSNVDERWNFVKKLRCCFSCLNVGHSTRECHKKKTCPREGCNRKHHKLLHNDPPRVPLPITPSTSSDIQQNVLSCSDNNRKTLFRVLPVTLYGEKCKLDIYALFDDGSSITMLDKDIATQIGVRGRNNVLNIQWFGGRSAREPSMTFNLKIKGSENKKSHLLRNVYAVSNLNLPAQSLTMEEIKIAFDELPDHLVKPYTNIVPKLLIGLDHAFLGLPRTTKSNNLLGPFACNTELGWVVFGPCESLPPPQQSCLFVHIEQEQEVHKMVQDYFDIENMGVRSAPLIEAEDLVLAKKTLQESTKRVGDRFQTGLLWKSNDVELPRSYSMALSRLEGIERKMRRDSNFSAAYTETLNGYIEKGYVRRVPPDNLDLKSKKKWYLPHFGVVNPNKEKRKLRLVFDAAAKANGISLNDNLLKGPQLISSLPATLYNFRIRKIAVSADIREMFHQILIQPTDRISQRLLWRNGDHTIPPVEYEMMVMTFGAACSPCSALHVMRTNALEHKACHPRAIEAICEHHYMDDFVDSFDTVEEAIEIAKQVRDIHKNGGFELRGFTSNSNDIIVALGGDSTTKPIAVKGSTEKILGLYWDSNTDAFKFNLKFNKIDQDVISGKKRPTKRQVLSVIMSTFDPLGFLGHFMIGGKLVLRNIWRTDCRWDEQIPDHILLSWEKWRSQLNNVQQFRLPRFYFLPGKPEELELHVFVDASEEAFAATAYWRILTVDGNIGVSFVCSKTKCAPLKKVSIPRLELQAAVLGTRIMQNVIADHKMEPKTTILWSDSKTVLKWISSSHRNYKPYVAHRVAEILQNTREDNWKWISTADNAADDATRSYNKVDFSASSRWLNGPKFLRESKDKWPKYVVSDTQPAEKDEEEIYSKASLLTVRNDFIKFERFSSYCRLKRSVAQMIRFINICRKKRSDSDIFGLTADDIEKAEKALCLQVQKESFLEDIKCVKKGQPVSKVNKLAGLTPYIDEDGLLRVFGRIDAASYLPYSTRHPIILPKDHYFSKLVVMYYHNEMKHQNHEATLCEIRKKFWIPQLRRLLRNIVSSCFMCRKNNATPATPFMGPLPSDRLEPYVTPFKYTGLDYFGPLSVSIGRRTEKRWVALFTCLTIRAIHLEIAHDLSTDSCIIAMKNFMNRRGVPVRIQSDNGKNFVGVNAEAKRFDEIFEAERIQGVLSAKGVEWVFNCPANPSEGGVWEKMVHCVKRVLHHTMKDISPKEHVLQSLLIEAENIVNSRPLTHLPISPHEEEPLTPNHFLIGVPNATQTPSINDPDEKLLRVKKQWRVARNLRDRFWKRWVMEYLPTLTRRVKWCERTEPLKEGDLVFICDPSLPRNQWRRGMVTRVYTGVDGVVRRADVRTASGELQRAVSKLAVLDIDVSEADRSTGAGVL